MASKRLIRTRLALLGCVVPILDSVQICWPRTIASLRGDVVDKLEAAGAKRSSHKDDEIVWKLAHGDCLIMNDYAANDMLLLRTKSTSLLVLWDPNGGMSYSSQTNYYRFRDVERSEWLSLLDAWL